MHAVPPSQLLPRVRLHGPVLLEPDGLDANEACRLAGC